MSHRSGVQTVTCLHPYSGVQYVNVDFRLSLWTSMHSEVSENCPWEHRVSSLEQHCKDDCVRCVLLWHNFSQSETSVRVTYLRATYLPARRVKHQCVSHICALPTYLREGSGSYGVSARVLSCAPLGLATARVSMPWGVGYPSRLGAWQQASKTNTAFKHYSQKDPGRVLTPP